jgi:phosphotransferase system HPr (HPr) family protein
VVNPDGIHARPAALIVGELAPLVARVTVATERAAQVSARSPTALMSLGTRAGHVLRIAADGADAAVAVERILALVRDDFGELASAEKTGRREPAIDGLGQCRIGVSPGRVVGRAVRLPDLTYEPDLTSSQRCCPQAERWSLSFH